MDNGYWGGNDCSKNSWINNGTYQFLLSPNASAIAANFVVAIDYHGHIDGSTADYNAAIRPSVYLLSSTKIIEGNGTTINPYKFG